MYAVPAKRIFQSCTQAVSSTPLRDCCSLMISLGEYNGDRLVDAGVEALIIEQSLESAGLSLASFAHSGEYRLLSLIIDLC